MEGDFGAETLDAEFVENRVSLVTRGYLRLQEIAASEHDGDVTRYPLPEAIDRYRRG